MKRTIQLYLVLFVAVAVVTYKYLGTPENVGKPGEPESFRQGPYNPNK